MQATSFDPALLSFTVGSAVAGASSLSRHFSYPFSPPLSQMWSPRATCSLCALLVLMPGRSTQSPIICCADGAADAFTAVRTPAADSLSFIDEEVCAIFSPHSAWQLSIVEGHGTCLVPLRPTPGVSDCSDFVKENANFTVCTELLTSAVNQALKNGKSLLVSSLLEFAIWKLADTPSCDILERVVVAVFASAAFLKRTFFICKVKILSQAVLLGATQPGTHPLPSLVKPASRNAYDLPVKQAPMLVGRSAWAECLTQTCHSRC